MSAPRVNHGGARPCPGCGATRVLNRTSGTCWCCTTVADEVAQAVAADEARWRQTAAFEQRLRAERGAA